jgi:curved DNA-binding protein CbpA
MRSERRNFYRVLHLQPDAPREVVRSNFFALMHKLRMHPDLGGDHWNAAQLTEAYGTLNDPQQRAVYDLELLERYDLAALGQGVPEARRSPSPRAHRGVNRRSYYRVLQVQREAPPAVLAASYEALRKQALAEGTSSDLLDEAFEVLGDPECRGRYDELLQSRGSHILAITELANATGYVPLITRFCVFCKTPHARVETSDHELCGECRSPLFAPPEELRAMARRAVARVKRSGRLLLYRYWPGRALRATLVDLSPTGMRFESAVPFEEGEVIKIDARKFCAVGAVAHRRVGWMAHDTGIRFLTVSFQETLGGFVSAKL